MKHSRFGILLMVSFNALIIFLGVFLFITVKQKYSPEVISKQRFTDYMNDIGCSLTDLQQKKNYKGIDTFLVTDAKSCPYLISYTIFNDNAVRNNLFNQMREDVLNGNGNVTLTRSVTFNLGKDYYEYFSSGDYYKAITLNDNSILYTSVNKEDKDEVSDIFNDLGYRQNIKADLVILISALALTIILFSFACMYGTLKKTRNRPQSAFIPIYNIGCLTKDVLGSPWYAILAFVVPYVNVVFMLVLMYKLGKVFGKSNIYSILLMIFPNILWPILAFDDSTYIKPIKKVKRKRAEDVQNKLDNVQNQVIKNEDSDNKVVNLVKWILSILLFLFGVIIFLTYFEEKLIIYLINAALFIIYGFLACPAITCYTRKYKTYTKFKSLIIVILAVINLIAFAIFPV